MLLPREKPFLSGLNSYYLDTEKFIQHLQGEIGTGCLHGKGAGQEILVYFDEYDIVRGVTQDTGEHALVSDQLDHVIAALLEKSFQVTVYYLDPDSIFFWGQMPAFRRAKGTLSSAKVSLPDLAFRLSKKNFSGFIEIDLRKKDKCAVLFFYEGQRRGGSYYWGRGGLSPSDDDYNTLLGMLQQSRGIYKLGYFTSDPATVSVSSVPLPEPEKEQEVAVKETTEEEESELNSAVNEFIQIFIGSVGKKAETDPLIDLKLKFIDFVSIYPVLDPYGDSCRLNDDGTVIFANGTAVKEGAEGIVDCAWMVIEELKMHKKFRAELKKMTARDILLNEGIELDR